MAVTSTTKTLKELAELVGGEICGDPGTLITGAADISDAGPGDVVFAESPKHLAEAMRSNASAIISGPDAKSDAKPLIKVSEPRYAFARVLEAFSTVTQPEPGIHPTSCIGEGVSLGEGVSVGYNVYVGNDVVLGNGVVLHPFVCIKDGAKLGDQCVIHPFVSIYERVEIGNRVIIHSGSVIGADGFGYTKVGDRHYKIPQIGTVVIGDDVEIGANVTIDRARTGRTEIGRGTKIDNLVHIAHNCTIGENCIIVGQVGMSGSVRVGNRVIIAGQAGIKDHVSIGDDAIVCARSGIIGDIPANSFVSGYPAGPHREQMRMHAALQRLPELLKQVRDLEQRVRELEKDLE